MDIQTVKETRDGDTYLVIYNDGSSAQVKKNNQSHVSRFGIQDWLDAGNVPEEAETLIELKARKISELDSEARERALQRIVVADAQVQTALTIARNAVNNANSKQAVENISANWPL